MIIYSHINESGVTKICIRKKRNETSEEWHDMTSLYYTTLPLTLQALECDNVHRGSTRVKCGVDSSESSMLFISWSGG
jgi:hypothetical protein